MRRFAALYSERLRSLPMHFSITHIMRAMSRTARDQQRREALRQRAAHNALCVMLRCMPKPPLGGWGAVRACKR